MSVSGLSSSTLQSLLAQLNSGSTSSGSNSANSILDALTQSGQTASTDNLEQSSGSSPAYVLSSSQQQSQSQLQSYSNLGALVNKAESSLSSLSSQNSLGIALNGSGQPLTSAVAVDVQSLATAQTVVTGSYPADDTNVLGTGTLELTVGNGAAVPITVTDGSLNGVAAAINDASAGIAASVKQNTDGSYSLQITGTNTGANNKFGLNGISDLVYDPSSGTGTLTATATAADAAYTVNGVSATSPTNDNVKLADGAVTSFTKTGVQSVASPVGQAQAATTAQTLVTDFNSLVAADPSASSSSSTNSATLTQVLDSVAGQSFAVNGQAKSLADYGITVGSNGQLSIDQSTLASSYSADPAGFNSLITQASKALNSTLSSSNGVADQVQSSVSSILNQLVQMPNLAQILSGDSSTASGDSSSSMASQLMSGLSA